MKIQKEKFIHLLISTKHIIIQDPWTSALL